VSAGGASQDRGVKRTYRLVDTEVHFTCPEQLTALRRLAGTSTNWDIGIFKLIWENPPALRLFTDVEDGGRVKAMDAAGVDFAVLSLAEPGVQDFDADTGTNIAATVNDRLSEAIAKNPTRLGGFGTFAPQDPQRAAKEIDRAINKLKLNGILVNSHTNGEYLDQSKFWPILEAAEAVGAPLYIHPRCVPDFAQALLKDAPLPLGGALWGYPTETSLHALRLITNGIFDRFPNLIVVLGHLGEGLPFWQYRIDYWYRGGPNVPTKLKKKPSEYLQSNFMITTSGMNHHPALEYCHKVVGADKIMFASDYPYQAEMYEASQFMNSAPLPEADVEKIAHSNAEKLFRVRAVKSTTLA
jgi:predicted TIM-barrel fold metal-dependent hydrolase